MTDFPSLDKL